MNLERDLEYSERSTRSKRILMTISFILAVMLIISVIVISKANSEKIALNQQLTTVQKEMETIQQKLEEANKEKEALKHQIASLTQEKDRLSKEIPIKKTPLIKRSKKKS